MNVLKSRQPWPVLALTTVLAFSQLYFGGRLRLTRMTQGAIDNLLVSTSAAGDNLPSSSLPTTPHFACSELVNSTVVREIGTGKQKSTFEIILPNGVHAAAKRCHSLKCINEKELLHEDYFFRNLHLQYGKDAITYYGMCSYAQDVDKRHDTLSDFSTGDSLFLELAQPVMANWTKMTIGESKKVQPDTDVDLESLRTIARQYDEFVGGRLLLGKDNKYPHQYVRAKAGIRHADFDMVKILPRDSPSILNENCALLMNKFAKLKWGDSRFVQCMNQSNPQVAS